MQMLKKVFYYSVGTIAAFLWVEAVLLSLVFWPERDLGKDGSAPKTLEEVGRGE